MNLKRTFGFILTLLGIVGLIYAAVTFVNTSGGVYNYKVLGVFGVLGLIFFHLWNQLGEKHQRRVVINYLQTKNRQRLRPLFYFKESSIETRVTSQ